ncbi:MAG: lysylphosphatidylglycerol synthase transmembrane domain-containing protein [Candidatus Neomarinimicrobiota bacterium]
MNKYLKLLLALIASITGLYFAFSGQDFESLRYSVSNVNINKVCIAIVLLISSCIPRALRWKLLVEPFESMSFYHVFSATMIGYFGNGILFFRLGEFLKAFALAKEYKITVSQAFGTVVVERILDLLMVLLIFLIVIPSFPLNDEKIKIALLFSSSIVVFIIAIIIIVYKLDFVERISQFRIFRTRYGKKTISPIQKLFEGVVAIFKNKNIFMIIFLSLFIWSIYFYIGVIVLDACKISLGYFEVGALTVISSFIIGIPSLPGAAGTLHSGVRYALEGVFQISAPKALSYAIISHAISYFPLLVIGFIYFLISNVSFEEVKKIR